MNLLTPTPALAAELPGTITVTTPSNGKLAAATGKQVVVLTVGGTNATTLSESTVTGVKLGADAACANIDSYVVTNATTITVKTPSAGCAASAGGTAEAIRILFGSDYIEKASALTFVTPPAITAAANKPVTTDNSLGLATADKITKFHTTGGQLVRVVADAGYAFDPRSSAGLSVSFSGKAGTDVKVYESATSTTTIANTATPTAGNALTFKTAAGMSTTDKTLTITQNGVSKTFTSTDTGTLTIGAAPIITSISPTNGRVGVAQQVVITGTGFDKDATKYGGSGAIDVKFCGVDATTYGSPAVNAAGTQITVQVPAAIFNVAPGLGTGKYAGPCDVQIVDSVATTESPLNAASTYTLVKE